MAGIAVIVPVYKVENVLRRCIDSVLAQTYTDFELILIDDGSPDQSPVICDEYAHRDNRVHVLHQQNSGPSVARNNGIDWVFSNSNCRYIAFVDSDDCLHPQFLERMYFAATSTNAQASMCRHEYIGFQKSMEGVLPCGDLEVSCVSAEDLMIEQSSSFNYAWGKLFARKCFEQLRYPEDVSFGEDNLIIYRALFGCDQIAFIDEKLYFYFYNPDGITKSPWSVRSLDVFTGIREQLKYYKENGFERAYNKEIELYIQQCAYQIHRIRADKLQLDTNRPYLCGLRKQMRQILRENKGYHLADNLFWFEALHPHMAKVWDLQTRLQNNFNHNGFLGTVNKVLKKYIPFIRGNRHE